MGVCRSAENGSGHRGSGRSRKVTKRGGAVNDRRETELSVKRDRGLQIKVMDERHSTKGLGIEAAIVRSGEGVSGSFCPAAPVIHGKTPFLSLFQKPARTL